MGEREEELTQTIRHIHKWLIGDGPMDAYKPVSARTANRICAIIERVDSGKTLKEAVDATGGEGQF